MFSVACASEETLRASDLHHVRTSPTLWDAHNDDWAGRESIDVPRLNSGDARVEAIPEHVLKPQYIFVGVRADSGTPSFARIPKIKSPPAALASEEASAKNSRVSASSSLAGSFSLYSMVRRSGSPEATRASISALEMESKSPAIIHAWC